MRPTLFSVVGSGIPLPPPTGTVSVLTIVMENESLSDIIGNPACPYINSLANTYCLLASSYAMGHPSAPNYLFMVYGQEFGVVGDPNPVGQAGSALHVG